MRKDLPEPVGGVVRIRITRPIPLDALVLPPETQEDRKRLEVPISTEVTLSLDCACGLHAQDDVVNYQEAIKGLEAVREPH